MEGENYTENLIEGQGIDSAEQQDEQKGKSGRNYDWLKQYHWQKGQSGNPAGGKKGKRLKTFVAEMLEKMNDEDKAIFLKKLDPEMVWRMAEGNPKQDTEISGNPDLPFSIKIIKQEIKQENGTDSQVIP